MAKVTLETTVKYYLYEPFILEQSEIVDGVVILKKIGYLQKIPFNFQTNSIEAKAEDAFQVQKYELIFSDTSQIPDYIKVLVERPEGKNIICPIIYFSPYDEDGLKDRQQLAKGNLLSNEMWIKKEQFQYDHFYINVQCEDQNCGYKLKFTGHQEVIFETMKTHSYYVTLNNTEMKFSFKNEFNINTNKLTLYATGGSNIKIRFEDFNEEQDAFEEGVTITVDLKSYKKTFDYFHLKVNANEGDYITVGAKIIDESGKSAQNTLSPDMGQMTGFLKVDVLEKECYALPDEETTKQEDTFYITGTLYNGIAQINYLDKNENPIEGDIETTREGFFSSVYNFKDSERRFLCIELLDLITRPSQSFSYSIQIQSKNDFNKDLFPPQFTGFIYSRTGLPTKTLSRKKFPHAE